jgi:tryptophan synthase beta subunit
VEEGGFYFPDRFGIFGGSYVPETLVEPIQQLEKAYWDAIHDPAFIVCMLFLFF